MRKLKLFPRTYLFTITLISTIILISHILIYLLLPTFYVNKKKEEVKNIGQTLVNKINGKDEQEISKIVKGYADKYDLYILMTIGNKTSTFQGIKLTDIYIDAEIIKDDLTIIPNINESIESNIEEADNRIENNMDSYISIKNSAIVRKEQFNISSGEYGNLKIIMNLEAFKEARDTIFMVLPYTLIISVIISLIAAYIYAKKITSPIKSICQVTKEMEKLNKRAICKVETDDEIGDLARNINNLYERLLSTIYSLEQEIENVSKSEKLKVDFLRSASHELKTPLMNIHIMLENMLLDIGKYKNHYIYLEKCKDVVEDLGNMVQKILDTSRFNSLDSKNKEDVDLLEVLEEVIKPYELIAKSKNINMIVNYNNSFTFNLDRELFNKALSNIISNAVKYTEEYKEIRVYFKDKALVIENECVPISKEHLENIFKAFYRIEFHRNRDNGGNGLGLYIVKQVLSTHKIPFSFEAIEGGMRFIILFENKI